MHYILDDNKTPVRVDWKTHSDWFFSHDRQVKLTELGGGLLISTVFVGLSTRQPPQLFETKSATWQEAVETHDDLVAHYVRALN